MTDEHKYEVHDLVLHPLSPAQVVLLLRKMVESCPDNNRMLEMNRGFAVLVLQRIDELEAASNRKFEGMDMNKEYVVCSVCGNTYRGYIPKGGDGSALFPRQHRRKVGSDRRWVCPGSFEPSKAFKEAEDVRLRGAD